MVLDLDIVLAPLALTQKQFTVGDKIRVTASFSYTVGVDTSVTFKAGPYYTNILGKHVVDSCVGSSIVSLPAAATPTTKTITVDFTLVPKAQGGIEDGTYGLRVWVEGTDAVAEQDSIIVVSGNPATGISGIMDTIMAMMPMMFLFMMMGMIMPMMQGAFGSKEGG